MEKKKSTIKVMEAIEFANSNGNPITKMELAGMMWPNSSGPSRYFNIQSIINGDTKKVSPEWLQLISNTTGVSVEFLLGMVEEPAKKCLTVEC